MASEKLIKLTLFLVFSAACTYMGLVYLPEKNASLEASDKLMTNKVLAKKQQAFKELVEFGIRKEIRQWNKNQTGERAFKIALVYTEDLLKDIPKAQEWAAKAVELLKSEVASFPETRDDYLTHIGIMDSIIKSYDILENEDEVQAWKNRKLAVLKNRWKIKPELIVLPLLAQESHNQGKYKESKHYHEVALKLRLAGKNSKILGSTVSNYLSYLFAHEEYKNTSKALLIAEQLTEKEIPIGMCALSMHYARDGSKRSPQELTQQHREPQISVEVATRAINAFIKYKKLVKKDGLAEGDIKCYLSGIFFFNTYFPIINAAPVISYLEDEMYQHRFNTHKTNSYQHILGKVYSNPAYGVFNYEKGVDLLSKAAKGYYFGDDVVPNKQATIDLKKARQYKP